jgi:hypothetical protein
MTDGAEDLDRNGRFDGAGEFDPRVGSDDDTDRDGLPNLTEDVVGSSRTDRDSDDDGIVDGLEVAGDSDMDGAADAVECDSDGDGLADGLERGLVSADADTDLAATCFRADADPSTTTDPTVADSDGGGMPDGAEDANRNGRADLRERNPQVAADDACSGATPAEIQGLLVTKAAVAVRLQWAPVADACTRYVVWSGDALPGLAPIASGLSTPSHVDGSPTGPTRITYYLVSADSSIGGAGPNGL